MIERITEIFGASCYLDEKNGLHKKINGAWVSAPSIQVKPNGKGFQMKWQDEIIITDIIT